MSTLTTELDQPTVEGAQGRAQALPLLLLLGLILLSPLIFDLAQRLAG